MQQTSQPQEGDLQTRVFNVESQLKMCQHVYSRLDEQEIPKLRKEMEEKNSAMMPKLMKVVEDQKKVIEVQKKEIESLKLDSKNEIDSLKAQTKKEIEAIELSMSNKLSEERKTCEKRLAEEKNKIETQYNQIMKAEMAKMKADLAMITPFDDTAFSNSAILTTEA